MFVATPVTPTPPLLTPHLLPDPPEGWYWELQSTPLKGQEISIYDLLVGRPDGRPAYASRRNKWKFKSKCKGSSSRY